MPPLEVLARKSVSPQKMQKISLFETENMFCDLYCLQPDQSQKPHSHKGADKIYFVLEGTGTFQIGDEESVLGPGMIVLAPSGVEHGVRNTSEGELNLLVFMAPNPNR